MKHLDLQVIEQALAWSQSGDTIWLCTVLATFGSSPREPGSWLVIRKDGQHVGSLSGGCVEEDFIERLKQGEFECPITMLRYGESGSLPGAHVVLPCGGILDVLIEQLLPNDHTHKHLKELQAALQGQCNRLRHVDLTTGETHLTDDDGAGPRVVMQHERSSVQLRVGPALRLVIAGISSVSMVCAEFAHALGYEVVVCDPRADEVRNVEMANVKVRLELPSRYIAAENCHSATAIVALTHDPRIDDLAMMEAVRTRAFYIGVMGSVRASTLRAERLRRSGGLNDKQIARIQMPIGLDLGSKTPAEIALAVMADIVRVQRGRQRHAL